MARSPSSLQQPKTQLERHFEALTSTGGLKVHTLAVRHEDRPPNRTFGCQLSVSNSDENIELMSSSPNKTKTRRRKESLMVERTQHKLDQAQGQDRTQMKEEVPVITSDLNILWSGDGLSDSKEGARLNAICNLYRDFGDTIKDYLSIRCSIQPDMMSSLMADLPAALEDAQTLSTDLGTTPDDDTRFFRPRFRSIQIKLDGWTLVQTKKSGSSPTKRQQCSTSCSCSYCASSPAQDTLAPDQLPDATNSTQPTHSVMMRSCTQHILDRTPLSGNTSQPKHVLACSCLNVPMEGLQQQYQSAKLYLAEHERQSGLAITTFVAKYGSSQSSQVLIPRMPTIHNQLGPTWVIAVRRNMAEADVLGVSYVADYIHRSISAQEHKQSLSLSLGTRFSQVSLSGTPLDDTDVPSSVPRLKLGPSPMKTHFTTSQLQIKDGAETECSTYHEDPGLITSDSEEAKRWLMSHYTSKASSGQHENKHEPASTDIPSVVFVVQSTSHSHHPSTIHALSISVLALDESRSIDTCVFHTTKRTRSLSGHPWLIEFLTSSSVVKLSYGFRSDQPQWKRLLNRRSRKAWLSSSRQPTLLSFVPILRACGLSDQTQLDVVSHYVLGHRLSNGLVYPDDANSMQSVIDRLAADAWKASRLVQAFGIHVIL